jgi:uncharacterized protein
MEHYTRLPRLAELHLIGQPGSHATLERRSSRNRDAPMNGVAFTAIQMEDVSGISIDRRRPQAELVSATVFTILDRNVLCSSATATPEGGPHINTAYFSYSEALDLYFLSHPASRHCRNLSIHSAMAMTVFSSAQQWTDPGQGIQLFGTSAQASGSLIEEAERSYAKRFPAYASWKATLQDDDPAHQYRFYVFHVAELKILDERTFGDAVFVRALVQRGG